jgi:hypothetical protein
VSTNYTHAEIRGAILRAAERIENAPQCYDHGYSEIGDVAKKNRGCVLAHIGYSLGMDADLIAHRVANAIGIKMRDACDYQSHLFKFLTDNFGDPITWPTAPQVAWTQDASIASKGLRAYADKYYPAVAEAADAADTNTATWASVKHATGWMPNRLALATGEGVRK